MAFHSSHSRNRRVWPAGACANSRMPRYCASGGALLHQRDEALEQIAAVARAGRRLGMVLDREYRLVLEGNAAVRAVEQRDVGLLGIGGQRRAVDREAVVHR